MTMGQFYLTPPLDFYILIYDNFEIFTPLPHFDKSWQKSEIIWVLHINLKKSNLGTLWKAVFWIQIEKFKPFYLSGHEMLNIQLENI